MSQKNILGALMVISLMAILFTSQNSQRWQTFLFFGVLFGVFWYFKS